jgi:hypothetical protein
MFNFSMLNLIKNVLICKISYRTTNRKDIGLLQLLFGFIYKVFVLFKNVMFIDNTNSSVFILNVQKEKEMVLINLSPAVGNFFFYTAVAAGVATAGYYIGSYIYNN